MDLPFRFIQAVPSVYTEEPVEVRLAGHGPGGIDPLGGADCFWDCEHGCYVIELDPERRAGWLLACLHEVAHVRNGDVPRLGPDDLAIRGKSEWSHVATLLHNLVIEVVTGATGEREALELIASHGGNEQGARFLIDLLRNKIQAERRATRWALSEVKRWERILASVYPSA